MARLFVERDQRLVFYHENQSALEFTVLQATTLVNGNLRANADRSGTLEKKCCPGKGKELPGAPALVARATVLALA